MFSINDITKKYWLIILAGFFTGVFAVTLVKYGNPGNMGLCIVCFLRDISGALGLHQTPPVQYIRPEIIGLVFGALLSSIIFGEFRSRGGSASLLRFALGIFIAIGAGVFMGCPTRMLLRLGGGDLNAVFGVIGFITGIIAGIICLKQGFNLGRANKLNLPTGLIMPVIMAGLLALLLFKPVFNPNVKGPIFFSLQGVGAQHAPIFISLGLGMVIGVLLQRSRFCTVAAFRDPLISRDYYFLWGVIALVIGAFITNQFLGFFKLGWINQPIAHTDYLWNFLGMALVGIACALVSGCPLRQLIMAGEGNSDAGSVVLGILVGTAIAHNFMMVSSPQGVSGFGPIGVIIGLGICLIIGFVTRETKTS
jgi:YedE family putative selenium metabolism protein